jgi:hypothetical protein
MKKYVAVQDLRALHADEQASKLESELLRDINSTNAASGSGN